MYNKIIEVDNINSKIKNVFSMLENSDYKNINDLSSETDINVSELTEVLKIMEKSEYINKVSEEKIKITEYGVLIKEGKINTGYAPV